MKTDPECLDCVIRQGNKVAENLIDDPNLIETVKNGIKKYVQNLTEKEMELSPAEISTPMYYLLRDLTGIIDPFEKQKKTQNKNALAIYRDLLESVREDEDQLHKSARISVIGNVIDCGVNSDIVMLEVELETALKQPLEVDDFDEFRKFLKDAKEILLITDNAGEIVFDKCFIETLKRFYPEIKIYVSVKSYPILNDATMKDARMIGLDSVCKIVTTGSNYIGTPRRFVSKKFVELMDRVNVVLAKGQGNFETLEGSGKKFFFLLKAKCPVIARHLKVSLGAHVFKQSN